MIAGYRNGEVDIATDLQDSDLPKVQDLGDQVSAIPSLTYEFLRPNWYTADEVRQGHPGSAAARRTPPSPTAARAARWPTRRCARPSPTPSTRTRSTPGCWAALAQVANTFVSPGAWFYVDQAPTTYDPDKASQILEDAGWKDTDGDGIREKDGMKAKIELCTTTRQVRQDTLALVAAWLKDVGIDTVINPVDAANIFADYNESTADTPCVLSHGNFDLAEHATSSSIDPLGNYFSYHSSQFDPIGVNNAGVNDPASTRPWTPQGQRGLQGDPRRDGGHPAGLRREDGRGPALLPQAGRPARPAARQLLREPHPGRSHLERRRLVRERVSVTRRGASAEAPRDH